MYVNGIILPAKIFSFSDWPKFLIYLKAQLFREVVNKRMNKDITCKHRQKERKEHTFVAEKIKSRQGAEMQRTHCSKRAPSPRTNNSYEHSTSNIITSTSLKEHCRINKEN